MKQRLMLLLGTLLVATGCGSSGSSISGVVTYEGDPVPNGVITFGSVEGGGAPMASKIRDGKYRIDEARTGAMKVTVSGYEIPEIPPGSNEPVYTREIVPYNATGNMQTVEVRSGKQTIDFHLTAPEQ